MTNVVLFPKASILKVTNVAYQASSQKLPPMDLEWWKSKNEKISEEFSLYDAHKKQVIMDEVLNMSDTMYEMIIDLRKQLGKSV